MKTLKSLLSLALLSLFIGCSVTAPVEDAGVPSPFDTIAGELDGQVFDTKVTKTQVFEDTSSFRILVSGEVDGVVYMTAFNFFDGADDPRDMADGTYKYGYEALMHGNGCTFDSDGGLMYDITADSVVMVVENDGDTVHVDYVLQYRNEERVGDAYAEVYGSMTLDK